MSLAAGTRVGAYEIVSALGAGGMGEVYRARDTRLKRDVALKILPESFASNPDRLARFQREAEVLASLNHPNIAHLYGLEQTDGAQALVMELVEGPTLADRIAQGPIPIDEALSIAKQMAEALEAAHEQGIIHRDLKPANVKVRSDGTVKVLDFGLAKALEPAAVTGRDATLSPTITSPAMMTGVGVLLGTAAYMAPEQAKGKPADKRSDIWAFGCVLYEMLTGKRAFEGEDVSDTLAAVLRAEPDWRALPPDSPLCVVTLLKRCLEKGRRRRIADIAVAQFVLTEQPGIAAPQTGASDAIERTRVRITMWSLLAAVIVTAALTAAAEWFLRPRPATPPPVVRFTFTLGADEQFSGATRLNLALSPDGTQIVYSANNRLYRRLIGDSVARAIPGTNNDGTVLSPVFSPDGRWVAYHRSSASDNAIRRIPVDGGVPATIIRIDAVAGMSWDERGILYAAGGLGEGGIFRVSPNGGPPEQLIRVDGEHLADAPQLLPDGDTLLFTLFSSPRGRVIDYDEAQVVTQSLTSGERSTLVEGASDGRYLRSGHLVFAVSGSLFAVGFDPAIHKVAGDRVPILAGVRRGSSLIGTAQFAVSDTGVLVYIPGPLDARAAPRVVSISDRGGATTMLKLPAARYAHPRVSPDGRSLAVAIDEGGDTDISIYDLTATAAIRRLTIEGRNQHPIWSHDGARVAFQSNREGDAAIFWQRADGQGAVERLTTAPKDAAHVPESFSPDGKHLLFSEQKGRIHTLFVLSLADKTVAPFGGVTSTTSPEAVFSPDGRWVAYASGAEGGLYSPESGIFVQPFPATGARFQVPKVRIDYHPAWSPDGKSLYFVNASPRPLSVVEVRTEPNVSFGSPMEVPSSIPRPGLLNGSRRGYDILPDGRILTVTPAREQESTDGVLQKDIDVVVNWFEELKRLVPTK
jgi:serine/threonine-protein kinase